jgi:hypothetical protein
MTTPFKTPTLQHFFVSFGAKSLVCMQILSTIPNPPQEAKLFFPNLYKVHNLYILLGEFVQDPLDLTVVVCSAPNFDRMFTNG